MHETGGEFELTSQKSAGVMRGTSASARARERERERERESERAREQERERERESDILLARWGGEAEVEG